MSKQKLSQILKKITSRERLALGLLCAALIVGVLSTPFALANQLQQQINQLEAQNSEKASQRQQLRIEADSLEATIRVLQGQIDGLMAQIRANEAKSADLQRQIVVAEEELGKQRKLLGENIKAMYLEGEISTLEMLASSKDLSEFVDKEQYRNSVKDKIKGTLDKVNALKLQLKGQKEQLEKTIADQQTMQGLLDLQRAEQARILGMNQAQRAELDTQIKNNSNRVSELRRQQALENQRFFGGTPGNGPACGGGYPGSATSRWGTWGCNYPLDNTIDNWGMYNRECVSYAAFRVAASGRDMPYWGGIGNANQWDDNARAAGIPVDTRPKVGDIAVSNGGYYGHVMYVEHVYGDGRILVSQYNAGWDGRYSEAVINTGGLVFIHF